jgi:protease-4
MKRFFSRLRRRHKVLFPIGVFLVLLFFASFLKNPSLKTYFQKIENVGGVAVIPIEGVIFDTEPFLEQINVFAQDPQVDVIVLKINSPGGAVAPVQELFQKLLKVREEKPIYASIGALAASGGYYLASASDKIFASRGSTVGSIGVIFQYIHYDGLLKKLGVNPVVIKSGAHKDIVSPFRAPSEKERGFIQEVVDESYQQFVADVALGRGIRKTQVEPYADGRIFSGSRAKDYGLIDELGGMEQLFNYIKDKHQFQNIELFQPEKNWQEILQNFSYALGIQYPLKNLQFSGLLAIYNF